METLQKLTTLVTAFKDKFDTAEYKAEDLETQVKTNKDNLRSHTEHTAQQFEDITTTQTLQRRRINEVDTAVRENAANITILSSRADDAEAEISARYTKLQERGDTL